MHCIGLCDLVKRSTLYLSGLTVICKKSSGRVVCRELEVVYVQMGKKGVENGAW